MWRYWRRIRGHEVAIKVGREEWRRVTGRREVVTAREGRRRRIGTMARGWWEVGVKMRLGVVSARDERGRRVRVGTV